MNRLPNLLSFQLGWFSCVLGAAYGVPWFGPAVVAILVPVHLMKAAHPSGEALFLLTATLGGTAIEALHASAGILSYPDWSRGAVTVGPTPLWMSALWTIFASTLHGALSWLSGRYRLALLLGALAGPLSYYAGARLGALQMGDHIGWSLLALALVWAIALPGLLWLAGRPSFR